MFALILLALLGVSSSAQALPEVSAGHPTVIPFTATVTTTRIVPGTQFTTPDGVVHTRGQVRYGTWDGTPDIVDGEIVVVLNADPPRIWGTTVHTTPDVVWRGVFEGTFGITPINFSRGFGIAWGSDGSVMFTRFDGPLRQGVIVSGPGEPTDRLTSAVTLQGQPDGSTTLNLAKLHLRALRAEHLDGVDFALFAFG